VGADDTDEDTVFVLIMYVSVGVFVFGFDNVAVLDIDLVCIAVMVKVGLPDIVLETEVDAVIVELMRPDKDRGGLLVCVTEAVVVLDTRGDPLTVVDRLAVFVGF